MNLELNFNIFNILILIGILQGIVFCAIVLMTKKYRALKSNCFLAFTVISLCFSNLQYILLDIKILEKLEFQIPFEFLIMPMFYSFVRSYLDFKFNNRTFALILTPFILSVLFRTILKFNIISFTREIEYWVYAVEEILAFVYSSFLIVKILYDITDYENIQKSHDVNMVKVKTKWLKKALVLGLFICFFWMFAIRFEVDYLGDLSKYYPLWLSISVLVYWIAYRGIIETSILDQRRKIRNDIVRVYGNGKKNFPINDDLFSEIENIIVLEKLYLNPNLNLDLIAKRFEISTSYLSKLINSKANKSFTDFINKLRVDESKIMLSNPDYMNYTIQAIGYESGFNSKSNFYVAFKKETHETPSSFRLKQKQL